MKNSMVWLLTAFVVGMCLFEFNRLHAEYKALAAENLRLSIKVDDYMEYAGSNWGGCECGK